MEEIGSSEAIPHRPHVYLAGGYLPVVATTYAAYTLTGRQLTRRYCDELIYKVDQVRGGAMRFQVGRTKHHIIVRDGNIVIFQCFKSEMNARCLYLEMFGAAFNISLWWERRQSNYFDNVIYATMPSPDV